MGHPSAEAQAPVKERNLNLGRNVQNVDRDGGGSLEMDCERVWGVCSVITAELRPGTASLLGR